MSKHATILLPLLAVLLFATCISEYDGPWATVQGTFSLELAADGLELEVETRAPRNLTDAEAAAYLVSLTQDESIVWQQKAFSTITQADRTQPLGGGYIVSAENVTANDAESANDGWGCLRYAGQSETFSIVSGQITHVTVPCRMANAGLNVIFDKSFTDYFTDYAVTTDDLRALKFNTNGYTAYYNTGSTGSHPLNIIISASAGWDGTVRLNRTLTLQAGKIIRLYVKLNSTEPTEGNISLSVTYDDGFDEGTNAEIILN